MVCFSFCRTDCSQVQCCMNCHHGTGCYSSSRSWLGSALMEATTETHYHSIRAACPTFLICDPHPPTLLVVDTRILSESVLPTPQ